MPHGSPSSRARTLSGRASPARTSTRSVLIHSCLLVRSAADFDLSNGSVGNFFFAGARLFLNSLNAAIFLYSRVSGLPEQTAVLPVIRSEADKTVVLGAVLEDGTLLRGQNAISHPSIAPGLSRSVSSGVSAAPDAASVTPAVVDKERPVEPLPSPIRRVCYLDRPRDRRLEPRCLGGRSERCESFLAIRSFWTASPAPSASSTAPAPLHLHLPMPHRGGHREASLSPAVPRVLMLNGFRTRNHQRQRPQWTRARTCVQSSMRSTVSERTQPAGQPPVAWRGGMSTCSIRAMGDAGFVWIGCARAWSVRAVAVRT